MFVLLFLEVIILIKVKIEHWRRLMLPYLGGQVDFNPEKWLISTSLGKITKS